MQRSQGIESLEWQQGGRHEKEADSVPGKGVMWKASRAQTPMAEIPNKQKCARSPLGACGFLDDLACDAAMPVGRFRPKYSLLSQCCMWSLTPGNIRHTPGLSRNM